MHSQSVTQGGRYRYRHTALRSPHPPAGGRGDGQRAAGARNGPPASGLREAPAMLLGCGLPPVRGAAHDGPGVGMACGHRGRGKIRSNHFRRSASVLCIFSRTQRRQHATSIRRKARPARQRPAPTIRHHFRSASRPSPSSRKRRSTHGRVQSVSRSRLSDASAARKSLVHSRNGAVLRFMRASDDPR